MRIVIDIGHPADVHLFRNFIRIMEQKGHQFYLYARNKDVCYELLDNYHLDFTPRGKGSDSFLGKISYLIITLIRFTPGIRKFKPDLFLSRASPYNSVFSYLLRKPNIIIDDTEINRYTKLIYKPLASSILTGEYFYLPLGKKQVVVNSYEPLAYLHPRYFRPDASVLKKTGLRKGKRFFILRWVTDRSLHQYREQENIREILPSLIEQLKPYGKILISSDQALDKSLQPYKLNLPPDRIHHLLYYAWITLGNSATMAGESALLGTETLYLGNSNRGYLMALKKEYGLVHYLPISSQTPEYIRMVLKDLVQRDPDKKEQSRIRDQIIRDHVDYTRWLVEFIENAI